MQGKSGNEPGVGFKESGRTQTAERNVYVSVVANECVSDAHGFSSLGKRVSESRGVRFVVPRLLGPPGDRRDPVELQFHLVIQHPPQAPDQAARLVMRLPQANNLGQRRSGENAECFLMNDLAAGVQFRHDEMGRRPER